MANKIKKVQIIRIEAYDGELSGKQEVLAELPSVKMANAAIREWQSIGHKAQLSINEGLTDNKPGSHYGCYVWRGVFLEPNSIGFDRYWNDDYWQNGAEILTERIYTKIIR